MWVVLTGGGRGFVVDLKDAEAATREALRRAAAEPSHPVTVAGALGGFVARLSNAERLGR